MKQPRITKLHFGLILAISPLIMSLSGASDPLKPSFAENFCERFDSLQMAYSKDEIVSFIGEPAYTDEFEDPSSEYLNYPEQGLSLLLIDNQLETAFLYSGIKGGYETGEFAQFECELKLKQGINMQSTYEEVIQIYGTPKEKGELSYAPIPSRWVGYGNVSFSFTAAEGKLIYITLKSLNFE